MSEILILRNREAPLLGQEVYLELRIPYINVAVLPMITSQATELSRFSSIYLLLLFDRWRDQRMTLKNCFTLQCSSANAGRRLSGKLPANFTLLVLFSSPQVFLLSLHNGGPRSLGKSLIDGDGDSKSAAFNEPCLRFADSDELLRHHFADTLVDTGFCRRTVKRVLSS